MDTNHGASESQTRKAAVGGLAVVGFVALILIGIATAIYAASFIPKALSRLGTANVYLGAQDGNSLEVQNPTSPTDNGAAPTSIPLSPATTTQNVPVVTQTPTQPTYTAPRPVYTQPTYVPVQQAYYGLPDLVTTITAVGYLSRSGDTNSFVAADTIPSGRQGAVRFTIANRGTNVSESWNFEARLPSDSNPTYRSSSQRSLKPGDSILFTLGFDGSNSGRDTVRITADSTDRVQESNEGNNQDTESIYLNGRGSSSNNDYDSNGTYCRYGTYYSNGRYYCESSSASNADRDYDSNGNYCRYGTYYQSGRYYCDNSSGSTSNIYDSFGNLCRSGVRTYQSGVYTCNDNSYTNGNDYDSNGNFCRYGTYYSNGRYYCN